MCNIAISNFAIFCNENGPLDDHAMNALNLLSNYLLNYKPWKEMEGKEKNLDWCQDGSCMYTYVPRKTTKDRREKRIGSVSSRQKPVPGVISLVSHAQ